MAKFRGKYRVESSRLQGWDYTDAGYYFVTICTSHHEPFFGQIRDGEMQLSSVGNIAYRCWVGIPDHFSHVQLDEFVIMPNHLHGIIIVVPEKATNNDLVETLHATSLPRSCDVKMSSISPRRGSLSVIVRSYKSSVSRWAHRNGHPDFSWQPRFYDHIIRNEASLGRIRRYIHDNLAKWQEDEYHPINLGRAP